MDEVRRICEQALRDSTKALFNVGWSIRNTTPGSSGAPAWREVLEILEAQHAILKTLTEMVFAADANKVPPQEGEQEYSAKTTPTGTKCSMCGEPQWTCPSGTTCDNGHGDAPSACEPGEHKWVRAADGFDWCCVVCSGVKSKIEPNTMLKLGGGAAFCCTDCGANVFTPLGDLKYKCNGCGVQFVGERGSANPVSQAPRPSAGPGSPDDEQDF